MINWQYSERFVGNKKQDMNVNSFSVLYVFFPDICSTCKNKYTNETNIGILYLLLQRVEQKNI